MLAILLLKQSISLTRTETKRVFLNIQELQTMVMVVGIASAVVKERLAMAQKAAKIYGISQQVELSVKLRRRLFM